MRATWSAVATGYRSRRAHWLCRRLSSLLHDLVLSKLPPLVWVGGGRHSHMQGVGEPDEEQEAGYPQQHAAAPAPVVSALRSLRRSFRRLVGLSPPTHNREKNVLSHPRHRSLTYLLTAGCSGGRTLDPVRRCPLYMGYYLGEIFFDNCVNVNGAPRMRTPSRRSGAWSCHAPGGDGCARSAGGRAAVCGAPAGRVPVLGRFHHRRTPCLCAGFGGPASRYCGAVRGCD